MFLTYLLLYLLANFGKHFFLVDINATSILPKYVAHNCNIVNFISDGIPSSINSFVNPIKTKLYNSHDVHPSSSPNNKMKNHKYLEMLNNI